MKILKSILPLGISTWSLMALVCASQLDAVEEHVPSGDADPSLLRQLLNIRWEKGPSLPQGFQDSAGGVIGDVLITVGGFCGGKKQSVPDIPGKEGKYPRGFLKKAWGLDLKHPKNGWQSLPDFPGDARQALSAVMVDEQLYCWGGFSYTAPFSYRDGYRLGKVRGEWRWVSLPPLPWNVGSAGIASIGSRIYCFGGADYDRKKFYTQNASTGGRARLGARLLSIDTKNLAAGWKELTSCPGTPRWVQAVASVNGQIYVIGGASGADNGANRICTIVDNWRYDPNDGRWTRLPDTPIATGNFPWGAIVFKDRFILLVGGAQYAKVLNPDGTVRETYGQVFKHYPNHVDDSDVLVYDTRTDTFGTANPLPLNNNMPMAVVYGDKLHLIGGETGGAEIGGERFGHHPDLYLVGRLSVR